MTFSSDLAFVLTWEGDESDDPNDKGRLTKHGITQATYDAFRVKHGQETQSVHNIVDTEVSAIYCGMFWVPAHCAELPDRLASVHFDTAVQRGPERAIKMLQSAIGVVVDGQWGVNTAKAARGCDENSALARYFVGWEAHILAELAADPSQHEFENGWRNRIAALRTFVGKA